MRSIGYRQSAAKAIGEGVKFFRSPHPGASLALGDSRCFASASFAR